MWVVCVMCLQLLLAAWPTRAAADGRTAPAEALSLYNEAREHYAAGRYHQAVVLLERALRLDPSSPNLMYNVARVNELLGNLDQAIVYYRRYLRALPMEEKDERKRIQEALHRLEGARREVTARTPPEDLRAPTLAPSPSSLGKADAWFWLTAGTGATLLVSGGLAGIVALYKQRRVAEFVVGADGSFANRAALVSNANSWALASDIMLGGGLLAAGGAALLFFGRKSEAHSNHSKARLDWHPRPGGGVLMLNGAL